MQLSSCTSKIPWGLVLIVLSSTCTHVGVFALKLMVAAIDRGLGSWITYKTSTLRSANRKYLSICCEKLPRTTGNENVFWMEINKIQLPIHTFWFMPGSETQPIEIKNANTTKHECKYHRSHLRCSASTMVPSLDINIYLQFLNSSMLNYN